MCDALGGFSLFSVNAARALKTHYIHTIIVQQSILHIFLVKYTYMFAFDRLLNVSLWFYRAPGVMFSQSFTNREKEQLT